MTPVRFLPFVLKQATRRRTRTALTIGGVGASMFLFCAVQAMQRGVDEATRTTSADTTLVVYRENRFCPFTSRLPEHYLSRIERIEGVRAVVPMRIVVNNCRAGLDVVTFRGAPPESVREMAATRFTFISGGIDEWEGRSDAAIIGESLARRRGLRVGDSFDAAGVTTSVAGIIRSEEAQDWNVAYVRLDFLQRVASRSGDGVVTQFDVKVDDPARLEEVAAAIDAEFRADSEPTRTRPEKEFVARTAADIVQIVAFTRWLGWGALAAVFGLVANAVVLSIQDRIKEHAILQTLGYRPGLIARLIVIEGAALGLAGGVLGAGAAMALVQFGGFSLSVEGVSIRVASDWRVVAVGLGISLLLGVGAGLVPAIQAGRREVATCFRAV